MQAYKNEVEFLTTVTMKSGYTFLVAWWKCISASKDELPSSSGARIWKTVKQTSSEKNIVELLYICLLGLLFETEDGNTTFLRNIGKLLYSIQRHIPEDNILQNWESLHTWV
jgi:hypothetical protein